MASRRAPRAGRGRHHHHARDGKAAVYAIAELAEEEQNEVVAAAYGTFDISFGPEYLIPKPFDPRLIVRIAPAVAKAAMEGGVSRARWPTWKPTKSSCSSSCTTPAPS